MISPSTAQNLFAEPEVTVEYRGDGSMVLRSPKSLPPAAPCVGAWLNSHAARTPGHVFLAERPTPDNAWRAMTYAATLAEVRALATWMLGRKLSAEHPLVVLSDNGIDHALVALAAMHVGVPVATISPAYSLLSKDHAKLRMMVALLDPGAIYVEDAATFASALAAIADLHNAVLIASDPGDADGITPLAELRRHTDDAAVDAAFATVGPDTIARFLYTSGSTGVPKAVINTQRMLCVNQEQKAVTWPFLAEEPPVILDWLPWSHTFGANHNFNMVLRNGGTLYIDRGKPAPHLFATTIANLKDVAPNIYFNVPRGFDMLVAAMRADDALRDRFFASVRLIFYAGAALPQNLWDALNALSLAAIGQPTPMVSSWGSTETAPLATDCHFLATHSGNIGIPVPGVEIKLVPNGDKREIRVRGPNVTPGYWRNPEQTAKAFDEEGYYLIGDAVRLCDPDRPEAGLYFDGRVSEDFKLNSGTWVHVGAVRVAAIAALDPVAQDVVVTGHDSDSVGFLIFPNIGACRTLAGLGEDAPIDAVLNAPAVRGRVRQGLRSMKAAGGGTSTYATRARLLATPPSVDDGEVTDKGYINQRAVLERRPDDVAALEGDDPAAWIGLD